MKTRIIKTKFWTDPGVLKLDPNTKYLFVHMLSCEKINMCGIFEYSDEEIKFYTGLKQELLNKAKDSLQKKKRILFHNGWVMVVNAKKHNAYQNSPRNAQTFEKELGDIPQEIKEYFETFLEEEITPTPLPEKEVKLDPKYYISYLKNMTPEGVEYYLNFFKDYPEITEGVIREEAEKSLDHKDIKGLNVVDYQAYLRNWLKNHIRFNKDKPKKVFNEGVDDRPINMSPEVLKHAQPKK